MTADTLPEIKTPTHKKKKTLLEKYEIPINHLEFDYVNKCCNILEIERILRILRYVLFAFHNSLNQILSIKFISVKSFAGAFNLFLCLGDYSVFMYVT